jgi:murein DD-endopeptidase MepM/ murein hydrolase activator NlpD
MLAGSWIAKEGRTYHLGIDIFTSGLDFLYAPTFGTVVRSDQEKGSHTYGYYTIIQYMIEKEVVYGFYGHLSAKLPPVGMTVFPGQRFAQLGDYIGDENGGWSRHVHVQLLRDLPEGEGWPTGYSTRENLAEQAGRFPNPNRILQIPGLENQN